MRPRSEYRSQLHHASSSRPSVARPVCLPTIAPTTACRSSAAASCALYVSQSSTCRRQLLEELRMMGEALDYTTRSARSSSASSSRRSLFSASTERTSPNCSPLASRTLSRSSPCPRTSVITRTTRRASRGSSSTATPHGPSSTWDWPVAPAHASPSLFDNYCCCTTQQGQSMFRLPLSASLRENCK